MSYCFLGSLRVNELFMIPTFNDILQYHLFKHTVDSEIFA